MLQGSRTPLTAEDRTLGRRRTRMRTRRGSMTERRGTRMMWGYMMRGWV
jgi:hypothetical protein